MQLRQHWCCCQIETHDKTPSEQPRENDHRYWKVFFSHADLRRPPTRAFFNIYEVMRSSRSLFTGVDLAWKHLVQIMCDFCWQISDKGKVDQKVCDCIIKNSILVVHQLHAPMYLRLQTGSQTLQLNWQTNLFQFRRKQMFVLQLWITVYSSHFRTSHATGQ